MEFPHCGPFKPSSEVFSLLFFARCRNKNIIFTISNSITQLHFSFEISSSFGLLLCPQCVSSKLLKQFFSVSFKGSASFPHQVSGNLNDSVLDYLLILPLLLCSITCKYTCSYHIFVAVSQVYFDIYGTISFTSSPYMTLVHTRLLSWLPNYFVAQWETESFCSIQMEGEGRVSYSFLPPEQEPKHTTEQPETPPSFRREVAFPLTAWGGEKNPTLMMQRLW